VAQRNQAFFYAHGPVAAFVRAAKVGAGPFVGPDHLLADNTPAYFLGHCEKSPEPAHEQKWKPVFSSQTGEVIPADKLYMGTEVKVILPLARFDYDVIQGLLAAPRMGRVSPPGTETYLDVGSMLQRNGLSFELWLRNEFAGTVNAAAYPNLPVGMYFLCCNIAGVYPANLGRDAAQCQLLIEANWVQAAGGAGSRLCYSQNPTYFKNLPDVG
jgi:hypothetical protein